MTVKNTLVSCINPKQQTTMFMIASGLCIAGFGISFFNTTAGTHIFLFASLFISIGIISMFSQSNDSEQKVKYDRPTPPADKQTDD